jgi:hypothetical protein
METNKIPIVIHIRLSALLTKSDYETVYNVLFTRRGLNETPTIRSCVNRFAIGTRTKNTLNDDDDDDEILIFWR